MVPNKMGRIWVLPPDRIQRIQCLFELGSPVRNVGEVQNLADVWIQVLETTDDKALFGLR